MKDTIKNSMKYGVSSKYSSGTWNHTVYGPFTAEAQAQEWLSTEEYDFRERELMSRTAAVRIAGRKAVENAINPADETVW